MKILVNTPSMALNSGGVSNHYYGLKPYWTENVRYNVVGKRKLKQGSGKYWLLWDVVKFIVLNIFWRPQVVLLNPSMAKNALKRDFIFLKIAKTLRKKVVIFIHGFHPEYCETVDVKNLAAQLNNADGILVLSQVYRASLQEWGVTCPVMVTTTKVDDRMLQGFDITNRKGNVQNVLFLARIEKEKGLYETISAYAILKEVYSDLKLTIVGIGTELETAKQYVQDRSIQDVTFTGRLQGDALSTQYRNADIYCFPSYSEGMPTTVLEAMAFGLPVVTRNVGGLVDFFDSEKMGVMTDTFDPSVFASAIKKYKEDRELTLQTSMYNFAYAGMHFLASRVAKNIENLLKQV